MKRTVFFTSVLLLLATVFSFPPSVQAACQLGPGKKFSMQVYFTGDRNSGSSLSANGKQFSRNPPQCTNPVSSGAYTMSCDTDTETFAADSLFAPLCGSSEERGKENGTCYSCGGVIKCDGFDGAVGNSSPFISQKTACAIDQNNPNPDVWCPAVPTQTQSAKTFTYNGKEYPYNGEQILICGSNTQACGSADSCTNILYPEAADQCSNAVGVAAGAAGSATPTCDSTGSVNVLDYFTPNCAGGNCTSQPINGSVFTDSAFYSGGITNSISRSGDTITQNTNLGGSTPRSITYKVVGNSIRMVEDHTFADEQTCTDTGNEAYQYIDGGQGIGLYNTSMTCGQSVTGTSTNEIYDETTHKKCANPLASTGSYESKLIFEGSAMCNGTQVDAVAFQNVSGKGAGEVLVYCKDASGGRGLCAFYSSIDFTQGSNDTKKWSGNDVCNGTFSPYPSCKVHGRPQATGVAPVNGTVNFGSKCGSNPISLGCIVERIEIAIAGTVQTTNNVIKLPDLTRLAGNLQTASPFTMPLALTKNEKNIRPLTFSATGTISVDSDAPGSHCYAENRGVITTVYTGLARTLQESLKIASNYTPDGRLEHGFADFRTMFPDQYLTAQDNRGCPDATPGLDQKVLEQHNSSFHEYTEVSGAAKAVLSLANRIPGLAQLLHGGQSCDPTKGQCGATSNFGAKVMAHTLTPYAETIAALFNISKSGESKGAMRTFLPVSARGAYAAALSKDQSFDYVGGTDLNGNPRMDVPSEAMGGVLQGWQDMRCGITPYNKQTQELSWSCTNTITGETIVLNPGDTVSSSLVMGESNPEFTRGTMLGVSSRSPDGNITNSWLLTMAHNEAAKAGVPACVIEGVGILEGSFAWSQNDYQTFQRTGQCVPNQCSAGGPWAFSTGKDGNGDTTCPQCPGAQGHCPNAWGNDPQSICEVPHATIRAAQKLKADGGFTSTNPTGQNAAIQAAGYAYFGSKSNKIGLTYNGRSLSYGDFLVERCRLFPQGQQ